MERTAENWERLYKLTSEQPQSRGLYHFTMGAEENANDSAPHKSPEWYEACFASLETILSYDADKDQAAFFKSLGFEW